MPTPEQGAMPRPIRVAAKPRPGGQACRQQNRQAHRKLWPCRQGRRNKLPCTSLGRSRLLRRLQMGGQQLMVHGPRHPWGKFRHLRQHPLGRRRRPRVPHSTWCCLRSEEDLGQGQPHSHSRHRVPCSRWRGVLAEEQVQCRLQPEGLVPLLIRRFRWGGVQSGHPHQWVRRMPRVQRRAMVLQKPR